MDHFPRPSLASALADDLQGRSFLGDASNGLFLAAPPGTGKSAFLLSELKPELQSRGITCLYCDLWADQMRDAASVIADTIISALPAVPSKTNPPRPAESCDASTIAPRRSVRSSIESAGDLTLADALRTLHDAVGMPVALIIDEAQHALSSSSGAMSMMALKSARDQLNQPGKVNLMLVMAGSEPDRLARLVQSSNAPFYGSFVKTLPYLGTDFVAHLGALLEQQRPVSREVDIDKLQLAFSLFGYRPNVFITAVGDVLNPLNSSSLRFEDALLRSGMQRALDDDQHIPAELAAAQAHLPEPPA